MLGNPLPQDLKVDIQESASMYKLQAEIPGVEKENIRVDIDGNVVKICAEVCHLDEKKEDEKVINSECYCGSVSHTLQLPAEIDQSAVDAIYKNGILTLTLPKKVKGTSQKIMIK